MNQIDLKDRRAVVTGGAQGIGFAIAQRLVASGAAVSVWDVDAKLAVSAAEELSTHGVAQGIGMDVTNPSEVDGGGYFDGEPVGRDRYSGRQCRYRRAESEDLGVSG